MGFLKKEGDIGETARLSRSKKV